MLIYKSCIELNIGEDDYCAYDVEAFCNDATEDDIVDEATGADLIKWHDTDFNFYVRGRKWCLAHGLYEKHGKAFRDALEQAKFTYDEAETDGYIQMLQEEAAEYAREDF